MKLQKIALPLLLATPLVARAEGPKSTKNPGETTVTERNLGKLSDTELQVLAHVHQNDMLEVKAGKLALAKASTQGVKSLGKMLVDDHGADARMILSLVQKQGLALPDVKPVSEGDRVDMTVAQETLSRLDQLHGKDFDVEFLRAQVAMHDKTLAKLDLQIAQVKAHPALVSMLREIRPVIAKHKDQAQTLLGSMGGNEQQRR
jgi:putative membrane protein